MKLLLVVLAVAGLATAAPTRDLGDDLRDFLDLIPLAEIRDIVEWYAQNDPEVQAVLEYLRGEEWADLVNAVRNHPTYQQFRQYLIDQGVDVQAIIDTIVDYIQSLGRRTPRRTTRSFVGMLDEIVAIIPTDDLLTLLDEKLNDSEEFQDLFRVISSQEAYEFVEEIRYLEETQRIAAVLTSWGVDVYGLLQAIYEFFGWA